MNLAAYNKSITALIAGALTWGAQVIASTSASITAPEWLALAGVAAVAFGVRQIANVPIVPDPPPSVRENTRGGSPLSEGIS